LPRSFTCCALATGAHHPLHSVPLGHSHPRLVDETEAPLKKRREKKKNNMHGAAQLHNRVKQNTPLLSHKKESVVSLALLV
jgi:hypothetical protein